MHQDAYAAGDHLPDLVQHAHGDFVGLGPFVALDHRGRLNDGHTVGAGDRRAAATRRLLEARRQAVVVIVTERVTLVAIEAD